MKITEVEAIPIGSPGEPPSSEGGIPLVTPLHIFEDFERLLGGPSCVGIRGGDVYYVIVRVHTDEGITGLGSVGVGHGSAVFIIREHLRRIVLGQNPFDVERLWGQMFRSTLNYGRKGVVIEAISGVDIALWDIIGKAVGQPVYNLIGGKTRDRIRVYASRLYAKEDLDALAEEAVAFKAQGFTAMKQRFGYGPASGPEGMRRNLTLVKTVRDAVGPDMELMADAYMGWDLPYAVRMIRMIEDAGVVLKWVEEPLIPDDMEGYCELRRSVDTPISAGEHEFTRYGHRDLIERRAVDILQPDVNRVGGITEAIKIWSMAAAHDLPVIPHMGQMHNYHLVISHLNSPMAEFLPPARPGTSPDEDNLHYALFTGEPLPQNGFIELSDRPGIGVELNEAQIAQWALPSV